MKLPDWRTMALDEGVVVEPGADADHVALWLRGGREGCFLLWERLSTVARAQVCQRGDLCAVPASSSRARQRVGGFCGRLWRRLRRGGAAQDWVLPNGAAAERCGERRTNLVLVWSEDGAVRLDEGRVKARWPGAMRLQRLGPNLLVVSGIEPAAVDRVVQMPAQTQPEARTDSESDDREQAEALLAAARRGGAPPAGSVGAHGPGAGSPARRGRAAWHRRSRRSTDGSARMRRPDGGARRHGQSWIGEDLGRGNRHGKEVF